MQLKTEKNLSAELQATLCASVYNAIQHKDAAFFETNKLSKFPSEYFLPRHFFQGKSPMFCARPLH